MKIRDRVLGMLFGHHAGESLGVTLEFMSPVLDRSHVDIVGREDVGFRPGQATDDVEMMLEVLRAMPDRSSLDVNTLRQGFIRWFDSEPVDIGMTCKRGIRNLKAGSIDGGTHEEDQGNGSLMRVAPLALLDVSKSELYQICSAQARLTHCSTVCTHADFLYVKLLRQILAGCDQRQALRYLEIQSEHHEELFWAVAHGTVSSWEKLPASGWALHGICAVAWALKNCRSYESAIVDIANRGNDADTNAAIVGAVFGALYGVEAIPQRWLQKLEEISALENHVTRLGF